MASKTDFVTQTRNAITKILDGLGEANEMLDHYVRLGYSDAENLDTPDFEATHPDITRADVVAAVGSLDAVNSLLAAGHGTNLEKLRRLAG